MYYPCPRGLCRRCRPSPYFSFPKFRRLHREDQRDLIEHVEISCEGIGAKSLVKLESPNFDMIQPSIPRGQHPNPRAKSRPFDPCRNIENPQHEREPRRKPSSRRLDVPLQLGDLRSEILLLLSGGPGSRLWQLTTDAGTEKIPGVLEVHRRPSVIKMNIQHTVYPALWRVNPVRRSTCRGQR